MKWTSVACAYLMVIAAFYVMTADASAEELELPDEGVDEIISNIEHNDRRITISDSMASSPTVAAGPNGDTHIAWVDGRTGSQKVMWKFSNDSLSTFTADKAITSSFHSISNISIVLGSDFGTAIAFEGRLTSDSPSSVYFLYSENDDDWSTAYAVSVGNVPSLTTDGDAVYIAMNVISDETTRYSFAKFQLIDGSVNATLLAALPVSASSGDISFFDDLLNVAMVEESTDALYFMHLTADGTVVTDPVLVSRTNRGSSVDLMSVNGQERILYVENGSVMLGCCLGAVSNWISHTVLEVNGTISQASLAASGSSLRIAYTFITNEGSAVYVAECDLQGNAGEIRNISTSGLDAFSPAVFSITSGSFSCFYAEEHASTQELFLRYDIDYVIPSIERLPSFISSISSHLFSNGNESRAELNDRVNVILSHRNDRKETLVLENATVLEEDLWSYFITTPYANIDEAEDVQKTISMNLADTSSSEASGLMAMRPPGPGGINYDVQLSFTVTSNTTATATWRVGNGLTGDTGYLEYGTSRWENLPYSITGTRITGTDFLNNTTYTFVANITGLESNTTYYGIATIYVGYERHLSDDLLSALSFKTYPDELTISSIAVSTSSSASATITWTTDGGSDSRVDYGTTASYGYQSYSAALTSSHSAILSGLQSNTVYHYKITSALNITNYSICGNTSDLTFTSASLTMTITSVTVETINSHYYQISWTTNLAGNATVKYGTTTSYGTTVNGNTGTTHYADLSGLSLSTTYHFKVGSWSSLDPSIYSWSNDLTFTTIGTMVISSVAYTLTDLDAVCITWITNLTGDSVVQYGTTTSYGQSASGNSGTSHSVNITGLSEGVTYHYRVGTMASIDSSIYAWSNDMTMTTRNIGDAGLGDDAGNDLASASLITPGSYNGYLDGSFDTNDYYLLPLLGGQTIRVILDVPTSFDYNLYLYDPSGTLMSSSTNGVGVDENLKCNITVSGDWRLRLFHNSGSGQGFYSLSIILMGGIDRFSLDIGSVGDNHLMPNLPGLCIMNGTGWDAASGGARQVAANGSFLLSIYDGTYQSSTYYQMAIAFTASADVGVQVLVGDSWVTVATMPGSTAANTFSFILKSEWLTDSSDALFACNVRLRFSHAVVVDSIDALAVAYVSDFFGSSQNYPGVMLENNWAIGDAVVNGSASATLLITLPSVNQTYLLEFVGLDAYTGIGVQQFVTSAYASIGTLESWGTSAVVQLNPTYTDAQGTTPGSTVRIKLTSAIKNLTRVVLWTSRYCTDVGAPGDTTASSNTPGISLLDNGEWGAIAHSGSVYWRSTVSDNNANFHLNGAESGAQYLVSITYKMTSGTASLKQFVNDTGTVTLGAFTTTTGTNWRTDTFVTSAATYDSVAGGQIDVLFEITSTSTTTVSVDSITVYKDSDGDTYSDAYEALRVTMSAIGTHVYDLNPFAADTDSDNLNDNVERTNSYLTDPTDADSDNDNLTDGSERYSYTWSTDESHLIPDNGTTLTITLQLPVVSGTITSLCLVIGIMHEAETQLRVQIDKNGGTKKTVKAYNTGSGANYFSLIDLFSISSPYSASDLTSASTWHISITDQTAGSDGRVEYVRLQVNGTTDPLDSDSDNDGLIDGEEVNFGNDGWYTNPCSSDSDSDGVTDGIEIAGTTLCGSATDPTRADTDDDGYADNVDRYMGDAVLRITLMEYKTLDTINGQNTVDVFFAINYLQAEQELATRRISATKNILCTLNWVYDIDIPDTATSVSVDFEAVAENCGYWPGNDVQLDIDADNTNILNTVWTISSTPSYFTGTDSGGSYDAYLKVKLERSIAEKAKVIIINGTGDDGDYGLDTVATGIYRYSADDQVYLINLNVSTANARFQQGMNTIILPRAIALQCQLNDTLYNLQSIGSTPLAGASFYSTDQDSASASSHVIAVITKNVTYLQAEDILTMLTHNSTGARIGNNVTISSSSLYLLHLPNDILSTIPTSVQNAGMGEGPNYLNPLGIISDIAGMAFNFMVWCLTGGVLLLWAHLIIMGLEIIANLITTAIAVIEEAVDAIVNAFMAFVDWTIEFINNVINTLFGPIIDAINEMVYDYITGLVNALSLAGIDYNQTGSVSPSTIIIFNSAFFGSLFWVLLGLNVVIQTVLGIISIVTNVVGFLIGIAISLVAQIIVQEFSTSGESSTVSGSQASYNVGCEIAPSGNFNLDLMGDEVEANGIDIDMDWAWGLFAILFSQLACKIAAGACADAFSEWGKMSLGFGFLSLIFATISQVIFCPNINAILAYTSLGLGFISIGMAIAETLYMGASAANIASIFVGLVALLISSYATILSWENI